MCIGIPMQVAHVEPGHAVCVGRGETRRVRTALVGDVSRGEWLLVFIDSAQERIDAARADEIDATLDLLQHAIDGTSAGIDRAGDAGVAFDLPSRWTTEQLRALSGAPTPSATECLP
jgi:hydrogenase expression/formation protein HypC